MISNLIGSEWRRPDVSDSLPIYNPATGEVIGQVPLSGAKEVDAAVKAAVTLPEAAGTRIGSPQQPEFLHVPPLLRPPTDR